MKITGWNELANYLQKSRSSISEWNQIPGFPKGALVSGKNQTYRQWDQLEIDRFIDEHCVHRIVDEVPFLKTDKHIAPMGFKKKRSGLEAPCLAKCGRETYHKSGKCKTCRTAS